MTDTVLYEKPQSKTSGPRVWSIPPALPADIDRALSKYSPILRQVLYNRGVTNDVQAATFLRGDYNLPTDPFLLTGMRKAVDRIRQAVEKGEKIAVYGDYDVDGVTASTLMFQLLTALHADVEVYIPNRFDEGYGINSSALEELKGRDITLVVSVDCGIRSVKEALVAKELGIDLIVTDHHLPGHELPEAYSVINPKQPGDLTLIRAWQGWEWLSSCLLRSYLNGLIRSRLTKKMLLTWWGWERWPMSYLLKGKTARWSAKGCARCGSRGGPAWSR